MIHPLRRVALTALVCGAAVAPAIADEVYVQIPGIPGESLSAKYPNWIAASAFGQDYNRRMCGGVTLTKSLDKASALLAMAAVDGQPLSMATIAVVKPGSTALEFLRIVLTDVIVSNVNIQGTAATTAISESVKLLPRSVTITYRQQQVDGALGAAVTTVVTCNRPVG